MESCCQIRLIVAEVLLLNWSHVECLFLGCDEYQPDSDQCVKCVLTDQLERVFLRLGHAETDEQLQDIISKFLPPVLLKLSSVQEGVRKKVRGVLFICT